MDTLNIDLETYSSVDIKKVGAWRYIDSKDFEILLCSFSLNRCKPVCIDLASGETLPPWLIDSLRDPYVTKKAYNAAFEWGCFSKYLGAYLPPDQWRCTQLKGLYAGFPAGLGAVGKALGIDEDKKKLNTGRALIKYFCSPCTPGKANGGRTRNYPRHSPERWELFKEYNIGDVVAEMAVDDALSGFTVPDNIQKEWETDLLINARGVAVDMDLVHGALAIGDKLKNNLLNEAMELSHLTNPNSVSQLSTWLREESGEEIESLNKDTVAKMLKKDTLSPEVTRMLEIRQALGKTSTKKYDAIRDAVCSDGRVRGLLQFYGANRTGRWAGRLVQVQNLPRTYIGVLDLARKLVKEKKSDNLEALYGGVQSTLSQLIRTAFVAQPGCVLIDADFSAIEARVISHLAGEEWRLEVFRTHGKIYEASAAMMFGVPIDKIVKGNPEYELRQKGKVAELALGYQGGSGALIAMGALDMGIPASDLSDIVTRWRDSNPRIKDLWYSVEAAAVDAISTGRCVGVRGLMFTREMRNGIDCLVVTLPSSRQLFYQAPQLGSNRWGKPSITYMGVEQGKWTRLETYGGKLTENIVQAIARDCLALAIERLTDAGYKITFHVHDEIIIECPEDKASLEDVIQKMSEPISWAPGLPLAADGWVGPYFKKD